MNRKQGSLLITVSYEFESHILQSEGQLWMHGYTVNTREMLKEHHSPVMNPAVSLVKRASTTEPHSWPWECLLLLFGKGISSWRETRERTVQAISLLSKQ